MSNKSVNFISTAFSHYLVQVVLKTSERQLPTMSMPCALRTFIYRYLVIVAYDSFRVNQCRALKGKAKF